MTLAAGSVEAVSRPDHRRNSGPRKPSNSASKRFLCHTGGRYGHWKDINRDDGSLKDNGKSLHTEAEFIASIISSTSDPPLKSDRKQSVSLSMACFSGNACQSSENADVPAMGSLIGRLVDDGAPYSAIENVKLRLLFEKLGETGDAILEELPDSLKGYTYW